MPNAANVDGVEAYPVLWQYAQNGNWNEVYTRILDHPEEAAYVVNGWTPLHLLVAGNGLPAPLAVVRAVYAAHPKALHRRTDHYGRTPLDIAVRWDQPREVLEFLADPTIFGHFCSARSFSVIFGRPDHFRLFLVGPTIFNNFGPARPLTVRVMVILKSLSGPFS